MSDFILNALKYRLLYQLDQSLKINGSSTNTIEDSFSQNQHSSTKNGEIMSR